MLTLKSIAVVLIGCIVLLAGCSNAQSSVGIEKGMVDAIQNYTSGLYGHDVTRMVAATCKQDVGTAQATIDQRPLEYTGNFDASGIVFTVEKRSGNLAELRIVSGTGKMNPFLKSLMFISTPEPAAILPPNTNNRIVLQNEIGVWKVCFGAIAAMNAVLLPTSSDDFLTIANLIRFFNVAGGLFAGITLLASGRRILRRMTPETPTNRRWAGYGLIIGGVIAIGAFVVLLVLNLTQAH